MYASKLIRSIFVLLSIMCLSVVNAQSFAGATAGGKPGAGGGPINPISNPYIGVATPGYPRVNLDFGYMDYFATDGFMSLVGLELSIQVGPGDPPVNIPGGSLLLQLFVDNTGALVSGVTGDDLVFSGDVDIDGDGIIDVSGVLLTGEVIGYTGTLGTGGVLDNFAFSVSLTGGLLFDEFGGNQVNVSISPNISTYFGIYTQNFKVIFVDGFLVGKGEPCTGSIGDYVWEDTNGNGIQDADETGINGVTVTLTDSDGNVTTVTTVTGGPDNAPGYYQFSMLCAGTYIVAVDLGTVPPGLDPTIITAPGSDPDNDSNDPAGTPVTLPDDDSTDQDTDFGFVPLLGSLGDFVWLDENMNGIQDIGEPGVEGVIVNLLDCGGVLLDSTMTDATGFYQFTDLPAGCYLVEFELPAGFEFTAPFATTIDLDSNANPITGISDMIDLAAGEDNPTIDAGIFIPANSSLGDFVWNDIDMDGIQDPGEEGVENVFVTLLDCDGNELQTTMTDATGFYEFTGLTAGCYKVMFALPPGFVFSPADQGGDDGLDSDADPANGMSPMIDLGPNEDNPTIDAGIFVPPTSSLGDFFWLDTNADGIQDPDEPGLEGVPVSLFSCAGVLIDTTVTGPGGAYLFSDLDAGCYYVVFDAPADCVLTVQGAGGNPMLDSNADPVTGQTGDVNLAAGDSDLTIDAGCYFTAGLGDFVWNDENQNGIQDPGEPGIPGLLVTLLDENMDPTGLTTVTGPSGEYSFLDLVPGDYFVQFSAPPDYVYTIQGAGMDDGVDSNANTTGKTGVINLSSGEFDPTIDAGVFLPTPLIPNISLEKATNGFDADLPTGPYIPVGGAVTWTYVVTNIGDVTLFDIEVIDDQGVVVTCPVSSIPPGDSITCTGTGVATIGQYVNNAEVCGNDGADVPTEVCDDDPSHYFGSNPSIDIEKATNGEDADLPTGPLVPAGNTVTWTYVVTNTGNVPLTDIVVTDSDPSVTVTCPFTELQPIGAGLSMMTCTATGTATLGQYANDSDVVGTPPVGPPVTDEDPSHYFGVDARITIEKATNGIDADDPNSGDAPQIAPGDPITWTYLVTNTGNVTLTNVEVLDDQGVLVSCPTDTLAPDEFMTCTGTGIAVDLSDPDVPNAVPGVCGITPGSPLYSNVGSATGMTPTGDTVNADDPSHYCNPAVCDISVNATCLIPVPPATDYMCTKPIDTLTFIWDGPGDVRIKAWKGNVGSELLADIDDIIPGEEISVTGYAGSPNDVYFEVFTAGTSTKIGESKFHLSCSDDEMDGPEDCGTLQGNGKDNDSSLINGWLLEGIVDQGGVLDCTPPDVTGSDSCEFQAFPVSCETIDNVDTLTLVYSGGTCADTDNDQGSKDICFGTVDGSLPAVVTLDNGDHFTVAPGESFTIPESGSGTGLTLSNSGGTQTLEIHTSCSAPLNTGDVYGAVTLQKINGLGLGTDVIYGYKITNNGDSQITSLSAVDIPLGPVPGLPATLDPGEMVTVFNTAFIDTTTTSTVIVDAVDVTGASCSAQDMTTVTIQDPPPCDIVGEGVLELSSDKVKWKLENLGASSARIESITITWPEDIGGNLIEVKFDGDKIYDLDIGGGMVTIGPADWINDPNKRVINPGDLDTLELKFDNNIDDDTVMSDYGITVNFEEGCSVTFVNTGLPFVCTKPIDELTMIWDGAVEPIQVKAWKGEAGSSDLLLDQSGITAGTEVVVSGYAGSPNDVYWEIFSGGSKIGESNFHMSCSDNDMNGADDCGKRQGNGKSDSTILINDWLLEGMVDADGPFDCTP